MGAYDLTTNVKTITDYFTQYGFIPNNTKQTVKGFTLYPQDYFCPKDFVTLEINITSNTHTIHHFAASWLPWHKTISYRVKKFIGIRNTKFVVAVKNFLRRKLQH